MHQLWSCVKEISIQTSESAKSCWNAVKWRIKSLAYFLSQTKAKEGCSGLKAPIRYGLYMGSTVSSAVY